MTLAARKLALLLAAALATATLVAVLPSGGISRRPVLESHMSGHFAGWEGDTAVMLANGQIWVQVDDYVQAYDGYTPGVRLFQSGNIWRMEVEGIDRAVEVKRVH
jgi:hypothetical protein